MERCRIRVRSGLLATGPPAQPSTELTDGQHIVQDFQHTNQDQSSHENKDISINESAAVTGHSVVTLELCAAGGDPLISFYAVAHDPSPAAGSKPVQHNNNSSTNKVHTSNNIDVICIDDDDESDHKPDVGDFLEIEIKEQVKIDVADTVQLPATAFSPSESLLHQCPSCRRTFCSAAVLRKHKKLHHKRRLLRCDVCSFQTFDSSLFHAHTLVEHNQMKQQRFFCSKPSCQFPFLSLQEKSRHELSIHGFERQFRCPKCGVRKSRATILRLHQKICLRRPLLVCPVCDRPFLRHSRYVAHLRLRHNVMSRGLPPRGLLTVSEVAASVAQATTSVISLVTSMDGKKEDSGEEVISMLTCPVDGLTFRHRKILHSHLHNHHIDMVRVVIPCPFGSDELTCSCGTAFNCKISYVRHVNSCEVNLSEVKEKRLQSDSDLEDGVIVLADSRIKNVQTAVAGSSKQTAARMAMCDILLASTRTTQPVAATLTHPTNRNETEKAPALEGTSVGIAVTPDGAMAAKVPTADTGTGIQVLDSLLSQTTRETARITTATEFLDCGVLQAGQASSAQSASFNGGRRLTRSKVIIIGDSSNSGSGAEDEAPAAAREIVALPIGRQVLCQLCGGRYPRSTIFHHFCIEKEEVVEDDSRGFMPAGPMGGVRRQQQETDIIVIQDSDSDSL